MTKKYKNIRRVTITGKKEEKEEAFSYCLKNGYRIIRSGPVIKSGYRVDQTRFKIIADQIRGVK